MNRAAEIRDLADRLLRLAEDEEGGASRDCNHSPSETSSHFADPIYLGRLAETLIRARRLRNSHFDGDLFADPAWDILLDLFVQRGAGKRVSVTSACIASSVPQTTALRWIALLEERGLLSRQEDLHDRRRVFLGLTNRGELAIAKYLVETGRYLRLSRPITFMLMGRGVS